MRATHTHRHTQTQGQTQRLIRYRPHTLQSITRAYTLLQTRRPHAATHTSRKLSMPRGLGLARAMLVERTNSVVACRSVAVVAPVQLLHPRAVTVVVWATHCQRLASHVLARAHVRSHSTNCAQLCSTEAHIAIVGIQAAVPRFKSSLQHRFHCCIDACRNPPRLATAPQ